MMKCGFTLLLWLRSKFVTFSPPYPLNQLWRTITHADLVVNTILF
nr:MAG TPA: hypothetical protein [Caudoviricetes sp.]